MYLCVYTYVCIYIYIYIHIYIYIYIIETLESQARARPYASKGVGQRAGTFQNYEN